MVRASAIKNPLRSFWMDPRKIHTFLRTFSVTLIGFCLLVFLSSIFDSASKTRSEHTIFNGHCSDAVDLRRDVARDLRNVFRDLKRAKDYNVPPEARSLLALQKILGRLDPRMMNLEDPDREVIAKSENESVTHRDVPTDVCQEHYVGRDNGDPYYTKNFIADCSNKVPVKDIASIVLDAFALKNTMLIELLDDILAWHEGISVYVTTASKDHQSIIEKYENVKLVRVTSSTPTTVRWARMIRLVTSKYIFVGYNLGAFSRYTDIERLVRVIQQVPYASYVSGATRNETGHWTVECYQTRLELYGLAVKEGYMNSAQECMYCDAVGGPFLTSTKLLKSLPLDERLPEAVVFHDWFLRIRAKDGLGLACPDVMFFVKGDLKKSLGERSSWRSLSVKWGVTDIYLPGRNTYRFTCEEAKLICNSSPNYLASPPCCVARLSRALREAIAAFDRAAVMVHISRSTVVGGVKGGLQPWESFAFISSHESPDDIKSAFAELHNSGFTVRRQELGLTTIYSLIAHSYNITLYLQPIDMKGDLPKSVRETPTRLRIGTGWVPAPPNPGLYARGFQGKGSLQHRPADGSWPPCKDPTHHACLDRLSMDGSWTRLR